MCPCSVISYSSPVVNGVVTEIYLIFDCSKFSPEGSFFFFFPTHKNEETNIVLVLVCSASVLISVSVSVAYSLLTSYFVILLFGSPNLYMHLKVL